MSHSTKHIAFVVKYFPTVSETFIVNQINSLMDAGYKVDLFAYEKVISAVHHDSLIRYGLLESVRYFVKPPVSKWLRLRTFFTWTWEHRKELVWSRFFKTLNLLRYGKDAYTLKLFFESQWFLLPYNFELIHAHFGMNGNRIAYLKAKDIIPESVKLINTFHGYDLEPDKLLDYTFDYSYLWKQAQAFTVNTPYLKGLLEQLHLNNRSVFILPVGLDTHFFKRQQNKRESTYFDIVFCGRLISFKAPDLAVSIIHALVQKGYTQVRLHIIGTGSMETALKAQVAVLGLDQHVLFYGSQDQKFIKSRFEQSDVFLLPGIEDPETGRAETQGLVIQEAQAMAVPVVVSDVGGMKYGLLPNESGFVVEERNLDGFINVIELLILNPKLQLIMGEKGRRFVVENYDNKVLANKLSAIYNSI